MTSSEWVGEARTHRGAISCELCAASRWSTSRLSPPRAAQPVGPSRYQRQAENCSMGDLHEIPNCPEYRLLASVESGIDFEVPFLGEFKGYFRRCIAHCFLCGLSVSQEETCCSFTFHIYHKATRFKPIFLRRRRLRRLGTCAQLDDIFIKTFELPIPVGGRVDVQL